MKHAVASYNTKKKLAASLKKAMNEKPFSKISVSEIMLDSGLNRKTFYYHFADIYGLLRWMLEEEAFSFVRQFDLLDDMEKALLYVMDYVETNDYMVNCVLDSISTEELKLFFYRDFTHMIARLINDVEKREAVTLEESYKQFLIQFYTGALASYLVDWIREKETIDRNSVVTYFSDTLKNSIIGVMRAQK